MGTIMKDVFNGDTGYAEQMGQKNNKNVWSNYWS
jgi:hypothetical protein